MNSSASPRAARGATGSPWTTAPTSKTPIDQPRDLAPDRRSAPHQQASTKQTETEKELAIARLQLLHAQVEPHFLYNTLGSAKYLVRSDPDGAERIIDNLILCFAIRCRGWRIR